VVLARRMQKRMTGRLFNSKLPDDKLSPLFKGVRDARCHIPTRGMLEEVFATYGDIDGNFIREFQTSGFSQRVWELYLHAYLSDAGFKRNLSMPFPDFVVSRDGVEIAIEAVTTNPTEGAGVKSDHSPPERDITFEQAHSLPIKIEKALSSKVNKGYAKHPHVSGKPLVLALEMFHDETSLTMSGSSLAQLLFGRRFLPKRHPDGRLEVIEEPIEEHADGKRTIPSGFFTWDTTRDISAVLFSNAGTIAKFQRMGQQGGHAAERLLVIRKGTVHDPDPNADLPMLFTYVVGDERFPEIWGESAFVIHNPHANVPLSRGLFAGAAEYWLEGGEFHQEVPFPHILGSVTLGFDLSQLEPKDVEAAFRTAIDNSGVGRMPEEMADQIRAATWGTDSSP
jgi:hypothetical protein